MSRRLRGLSHWKNRQCHFRAVRRRIFPSRPREKAKRPTAASSITRTRSNALFTRKLYDLAIPEYQKYLDDYPGRSGRANAYFSLGECYRNLSRSSNARTNFQKVLNDYSDSEFAGPAAYALAETAFTQKDYPAALSLFHRSGPLQNRRNRLLRFPRVISRRVVWRFLAARMKPPIFIRRLPRPEIRTPIARTRD
ncbi:MAG: hypothetical protein DMF43_01580 [Verrucomicrobia bacterium]|nr:MAG: hypothetical protein DMF43_01580 [Verrucomicrobiota bacterium]